MKNRTTLKACFACGLVQTVPRCLENSVARCVRCDSELFLPRQAAVVLEKTFHASLAALILLLPGIFLPVMKLERFGHEHETGVLDGAITLLHDGHFFLGLLILLCSVIIPFLKLGGLLFLSFRPGCLGTPQQALLLKILKTAGRWGMLDVLLIALLTAAVKLGDIVHITPGNGALVFSLAVFLSLLASLVFDPQAVWETPETETVS